MPRFRSPSLMARRAIVFATLESSSVSIRARGGVLIREGFVIENNELLEPQVQIDKKTLERLIALFSTLGADNADVEVKRADVSRALIAVAGEGYDPKENIAEIVKKR